MACLQQGGQGFTGPSRSGWVVDPCRFARSMTASTVGMGYSRVVAGLLFPVPTRSCASILQATCKHHEVTHDGGFKIMVALPCARVLLWKGLGEIPAYPDAVPNSRGTIPS
jgi:hypothetical protein